MTVNKNLLYDIFDHLHAVFFLDSLKQEYKPQGFKKIYLIDPIYQTIYQTGENSGQKFEQAVYHHLKKHHDQLFYRADAKGEVDFINEHGRNIQVCRTLNDENH